MDLPVIINFRWTVQELLTAQRMHLRYARRGRFLRLIRLCGLAGIPAGIAVTLQDVSSWFGPYLVFIGILSLLLPLIMRSVTARQFSKRPDKDMDLEWQISTGRLVAKTTLSNAETSWSMIATVIRTPAGFLFYLNDQILHWLPLHGFRDPADVERLADMAQSRVRQYFVGGVSGK